MPVHSASIPTDSRLNVAPTIEPCFASTIADDGAVAAFELHNIVKSWRGPGRVLDQVSLSIAPGSAVHLSGRNGCGKTTLLRIAIGLIKPEAGLVSSAGLFPDLHRRRYQQRLGYLPAGDRALYARMTVSDHLKFWARLNFIPRADERAAIERTLVRFGLEELADRRVDRISMGQRQRVRIGGSFIHDPAVVLLDEPRNSLDDDGIALLVNWLNDLLRDGGAVLWCSPNGEAAELDFTERYGLVNGRLNRI